MGLFEAGFRFEGWVCQVRIMISHLPTSRTQINTHRCISHPLAKKLGGVFNEVKWHQRGERGFFFFLFKKGCIHFSLPLDLLPSNSTHLAQSLLCHRLTSLSSLCAHFPRRVHYLAVRKVSFFPTFYLHAKWSQIIHQRFVQLYFPLPLSQLLPYLKSDEA